jgi:hypothetical protein
MLDTCVRNAVNNYCPVVFAIKDETLVKYYKGKTYMLQVWSQQKKILVYQKLFDEKVVDWFISDKYFVYQTPHDDGKDTQVVVMQLSDQGDTSGITIKLANLPDDQTRRQAFIEVQNPEFEVDGDGNKIHKPSTHGYLVITLVYDDSSSVGEN